MKTNPRIILLTSAIVLFAHIPNGISGQKKFKNESEWNESQLGPLPHGYSRPYFEKVKAFFLVPEGWTVQQETKGTTEAIFITKEPFDEHGLFKIGFSVNVIKGYLKENLDADVIDAILRKLFENVRQAAKVGELDPRGDGEYFKGYFAAVGSQTENGEKIFSPSLFLVNIHSGTLYSFIIEAPIEDWEREKDRLTTIMSSLSLDPRY